MSAPVAPAPQARARPPPPSLLQAASLLAGPGTRQFLRSKTMIGIGLCLAFCLGMAILIRSAAEGSPATNFQAMELVILSVVIVPLISLLFGTAAVATERESGTLPYLFTRPIPRAAVVVGKGVAAILLANAAVLLAVLLTWIGFGMPARGGVLGGAGALLLETTALTALFVLLGTLVARSLYLGLAYIVLFEGLLGNTLGRSPYTVSYHGRNLLQRWGGSVLPAELRPFFPETAGTSVLILLAITVGALALASLWVENREYGLRDRPKEE